MTLSWRTPVAAAAIVAMLLVGGCSDDADPDPLLLEDTKTPRPQTPPSADPETPSGHSDAELVEALPTTGKQLHGLAVFESCTDFTTPGDCLDQDPGSVVVNLSDGMNQGLLFTVVKEHTRAEFRERGAVCPDGPIDDAPQELDSGGEIPGRQGTSERTPWDHAGWKGWVCTADYTQVDSDGVTTDSYSLTLLLATDGHHLLSVQTASDVDVEQWATEYVDRLVAG